MPAVPGAREKLTERKKSGIKLIVVTGRSEGLRARTQERLERYFPGIFEEIIFGQELTPQERKKSEICKSAGIELMIEDRLPIVQELANAGIPSFLLDNPRNQLSEEETENPQVHRVQHWAEISR